MNTHFSFGDSINPLPKTKTHSIWPANAQVATKHDDLQGILDSFKNILISPWAPTTELKDGIDCCPYDRLPELDKVLDPREIPNLSDIVETPLGKKLLSELSPTISDFAALLPQQKIRVMLVRTLGRTCPLFHVDRVTLRLLCTCRGPGTEWLADSDVMRKGLGHGDNNKVLAAGGVVYAVPTHHICVLKGDAFKGNAGSGIVHRSPSVPGNSGGRWYLRVDFE